MKDHTDRSVETLCCDPSSVWAPQILCGHERHKLPGGRPWLQLSTDLWSDWRTLTSDFIPALQQQEDGSHRAGRPPPNRTLTLSTRPRQRRSGWGTALSQTRTQRPGPTVPTWPSCRGEQQNVPESWCVKLRASRSEELLLPERSLWILLSVWSVSVGAAATRSAKISWEETLILHNPQSSLTRWRWERVYILGWNIPLIKKNIVT